MPWASSTRPRKRLTSRNPVLRADKLFYHSLPDIKVWKEAGIKHHKTSCEIQKDTISADTWDKGCHWTWGSSSLKPSDGCVSLFTHLWYQGWILFKVCHDPGKCASPRSRKDKGRKYISCKVKECWVYTLTRRGSEKSKPPPLAAIHGPSKAQLDLWQNYPSDEPFASCF